MSEILNNYFLTVFTEEDLATMLQIENRINSYLPNKDVEVFVDIDITRIKVTTALGKLKENKSAVGDGLNSSYLLSLKEVLVELLSLLYAKSLKYSEVPYDWKTANITVIIIKDEIVSHLERNGLLGSSQHGFCKQNSCLTNLLEYLQIVVNTLDAGQPADVIYVVFRKRSIRFPMKDC